MRIEAVQNERRPYTTKHDILSNGINNQGIRKSNENNVEIFKHKQNFISFF
jgi:hypothetical protein